MKKFILIIAALFAFALIGVSGLGIASAADSSTTTQQSMGWHDGCTTGSNGQCTITNRAGVNPDSIVITPRRTVVPVNISSTATDITFRFIQTGSSAVFVGAVNFDVHVDYTPVVVTTPPTTPPTTRPTTQPTTSGPTTQPTTDPPVGVDWPSEANTGPADSVVLTTYTGPQTITVPNTVIDSKTINSDLDIKTTGVVVKNSVINGEVSNYDNGATSSFTIQDSIVKNGARDACMCIGSHDFTALRVEVIGGNRGMYCEKNCKIQDSYVHASALQGEQHGSAIRVEQNTTLIHNKLACDWTDLSNSEIGCSADMTGYPDFAPIKNNTIDNNYFVANPKGLGFCAYGGGTNGKPYSSDPTNGTNIKFTNNVFEKGTTGSKLCGTWGAITDFYPSRTGNVWTNNKWDDGSTVAPA